MHKSIGYKLHNMVAMPQYNTPLAIEIIQRDMRAAFPENRTLPTLIGKPYAVMLAYQFMAKYPRGKGTTKNEMLRRFYAACYSLHRAQTDGSSGLFRAMAGLTKAQTEALLALDPTGGIRIKAAKTRQMDALYARGLATYHGEEQWLTDLGIAAVRSLKVTAERTTRIKAVAVSERLKGLLDGAISYSRGKVMGRYETDTDVDNVLVLFSPRPTTDFIEFGGSTVPKALALLEAMGVPEEA